MNEADEYMLHVHYMNEDDDEIMILNIYMLYVHYMSKMMKLCWTYVLCASHKVLSHGTIMLWSGPYAADDG
jgi:hypothetical protein